MTPSQQSALSALAVASETLTATAAAVAEAERVLRASLVPVEPPAPEPAPPPIPEPVPPPPAPAPPPSAIALQQRVIADRLRVVCFAGWLKTNSYDRYPAVEVLKPAASAVTIYGYELGNVSHRVLSASTYTLLINGVDSGQFVVPAGAKTATVQVDMSAHQDGWVTFDLRDPATGESVIPWTAYLLRGETATDPRTLIEQANYDVFKHKPAVFRHGVVAAGWNPTPRPLTPPLRECPPITTLTTQAQLKRTHLVPWRGHNADSYRPNVRPDGIRHCLNPQPYAYFQMMADLPPFPLLDGPRGVGTVTMPTHLEVGKASFPITEANQPYFPGSAIGDEWFVGNIYFCEPWRVGKVRASGEVVTLAGWRHAYPGGPLELVGDWSEISPERRGFLELWGIAWDERRNVRDPAGIPSPDPRERGLIPHPPGFGMVQFVVDSRRGTVYRLEYSPTSHFTPPKITEFITGLNDPFDVVADNARACLYVSERGGHRISAFDMDTGAHLRTMVDGAALSYTTPERLVRRLASIDMIRQQPCVGPEGLAYQDDLLLFGSVAMKQIRAVHVVTGAVDIVDAEIKADDNSHFVKIALSDGTFGPRGKVFYSSWTSQNAGHPMGIPTNWSGQGGKGAYTGPGAPWETLGYSAAVGVGRGRLVCGSSSEGLTVIHAAASEPVISETQWAAWKKAWVADGMHLLHDWEGFGHFGLPLPWGQGHDDYLIACGHTRPQ